MNIEFHPAAKATFDKMGEDLLQRVHPFEPAAAAPKGGFRPDLFVSATLTEKDIVGPILKKVIDPLTHKVKEITFGGLFVLGESDLDELEKTAESITKNPPLKEHASRSYATSVILDWLAKRFRNDIAPTLTEYFTNRATFDIKHLEIWFPISYLYVESEISLGAVAFRMITQDFLDAALESMIADLPGEKKTKAREQFAARRKRLQGLAAAVLSFEAERSYATEAGLTTADTVVALLRVLHPANMHPESLLHCRPLGRENAESSIAIFIDEDGKCFGMDSGMLPPTPVPLTLTDFIVEKLRPDGLDALDELLSLSKRSPFQQDLIDALLTYSRNNIAREPADKLMAILVALESLLLKDYSESIQQNLGDRMAFILGSTIDERLSISRLVKDVYGMRSRFIHHGENLSDLELLRSFMRYSWVLFLRLLRDHSRFQDRLSLLNSIDRMKFS